MKYLRMTAKSFTKIALEFGRNGANLTITLRRNGHTLVNVNWVWLWRQPTH